jgi:RNA polymerase sigma factor (TIGR02999 family)
MGEITQLLRDARAGGTAAREELFTLMYHELQRLARSRLGRESTLSQLDTHALVHETYLRLSGGRPLPEGDRRSFFAYAASTMRSVVVDYARARRAAKRGGGVEPVTLNTGIGDGDGGDAGSPDIEALDLALRDLQQIDERCHQIVELRYFAGLSIEQVADVLELSPATVKREWAKARAFLYKALQPP